MTLNHLSNNYKNDCKETQYWFELKRSLIMVCKTFENKKTLKLLDNSFIFKTLHIYIHICRCFLCLYTICLNKNKHLHFVINFNENKIINLISYAKHVYQDLNQTQFGIYLKNKYHWINFLFNDFVICLVVFLYL